MLSLVSTPIGNLSDITLRALDTLKNSDYILCEDTRHASILLNHYQIKIPLKSFHQFNEKKMEEQILKDLKNNKKISLISDAGTPGISDPGQQLVSRCISENIPVTSIPGPCAVITSLTSSGLDTSPFQFVGFPPKKDQALKLFLFDIFLYSGTTICYESPNRIIDLLKMIASIDGERKLVIGRELTKKFESFYRGTALSLYEELKSFSFKGEIVLLIADNPNYSLKQWEQISPIDHVTKIETTFGITHLEAIKLVVNLRNIPRKELYLKK